jgi:DNA end-binding protein Ku
MAHAIWQGSISFGLVSIPVALFPAEDTGERLSFHLLDSRDLSPVKQRRVNARTGEEVPWDRVVKGYEIEEGRWVVLDDEDFRAANPSATGTIDILAAVCAEQIAPEYFAKPYYLVPSAQGLKAYALLRDTLRTEKRVALGRIVIRTRQHLVALMPEGNMLLLEVLRYPHELRDAGAFDVPTDDRAAIGVTDAELAVAGELVRAIAADFDPSDPAYRDTYHDDLLALLERKAAGATAVTPQQQEAPPEGEVVDIVELLKRSLQDARRAHG